MSLSWTEPLAVPILRAARTKVCVCHHLMTVQDAMDSLGMPSIQEIVHPWSWRTSDSYGQAREKAHSYPRSARKKDRSFGTIGRRSHVFLIIANGLWQWVLVWFSRHFPVVSWRVNPVSGEKTTEAMQLLAVDVDDFYTNISPDIIHLGPWSCQNHWLQQVSQILVNIWMQ